MGRAAVNSPRGRIPPATKLEEVRKLRCGNRARAIVVTPVSHGQAIAYNDGDTLNTPPVVKWDQTGRTEEECLLTSSAKCLIMLDDVHFYCGATESRKDGCAMGY